MSSLERLPKKGIYTLVILVSNRLRVNLGRRGPRTFLPGYYTYTGSALGNGATNLPNRLARHLKTTKRKHWHIDFLLVNKEVSVEAAVAVSSKEKLECKANQLVRNKTKANVLIPKFGASDCESKCKSHLLFFPDITRTETLTGKIVEVFRQISNDHPVHIFAPGAKRLQAARLQVPT